MKRDYVKNLKQYVKEDEIYKNYLEKEDDDFSDFDVFCIEHCQDIEDIISENEELKKEIEQKDLRLKLLDEMELQLVEKNKQIIKLKDKLSMQEDKMEFLRKREIELQLKEFKK